LQWADGALEILNRVAGGFAFILGLIFGSFLNVCIYRLPRGLSVVRPRSACPNCGQPIAAYDNIPLLSWLLLGGRCRHCRARITPRYMFVELALGLLFLACYDAFGLTLATIKWCSFCFLVLGLIFADAETHLLPDKLTLPGLALGLLWSLWVPVPGPLSSWFAPQVSPFPEFARLASLGNAVLGAAVGAGFIYISGALYLRWRGVEGMGLGDVKLMAMVGAFLGPALTLFALITASVGGGLYGVMVVLNVFRKRWQRYHRAQFARQTQPGSPANATVAHAGMENRHPPGAPLLRPWSRARQSASLALRFHEMPFGVFLGSMALFAFFLGNRLLDWYLSLF
jgi:leader peptidase (prepilin peptidase)/N-methyltransferase